MFMNIILVALAPVLIIAFYIYFRDKYEHEPLGMLLKSLLAGAIIVIPVIFIERLTISFSIYLQGLPKAMYDAFLVAALTEESFKYLALILLIWKNPNFNEKFDGIVYAVFISLGFAGVENILYVSSLGLQVGLTRAFTAVPAHAVFGIMMGFYFGFARFYPAVRTKYLIRALIYPIIFHGVYDYLLMSGQQLLLLLFIPFVVFMWVMGFRRMKELSERSVYRN
jgi:protease PrsW